ncbi:MarR family winged helix-turn-helix transcriptional regulator [Ruania zhangjianzhongii]|uniref:MarR family winged helix-turn-helix transcriptional regulator n=1 Tax=Ruania zhangjianzhongii TaxID=2603206 RepID=UPI0011C7A1EF|nr:MarR family transcriptional regulator [Ruania zhangjianzhongii]
MHDVDRIANLLGAAALGLTDRALDGAAQVRRLSTSSTAALISLYATPGLSVSELGRRVRLSQPAAARMVDSLEADGAVRRAPSTVNRRWMTVHLTDQGCALAQELLGARRVPLRQAVEKLDPDDQHALAGLLERILYELEEGTGQGQRICRLCDREACIRTAACPIGRAERGEPR